MPASSPLVSTRITAFPFSGSGGNHNGTIDPLVGAKGRFDLTSRFYLTGWAMVGGFGVSSDFMWDAWGGIGYEFNDTFSTVIGYRGTGVDYENDGFEYDVIQQGPVIGGVIRF